MFTVSKELVVAEFDILNKVMFGSSLSFPEFEIDGGMFPEYGYCIREADEEPVVIGLRGYYETMDEFRNVLVHEMIHVQQYNMGYEPCHDDFFVNTATAISRQWDFCDPINFWN